MIDNDIVRNIDARIDIDCLQENERACLMRLNNVAIHTQRV